LVNKIEGCKKVFTGNNCKDLLPLPPAPPRVPPELITNLTVKKEQVKGSLKKLIHKCLKKPYKSEKSLQFYLDLLSTNFKDLQKETLGDIPRSLDNITDCLDDKLKASGKRNKEILKKLNKMKEHLEKGYGIGIPKEIVHQLILKYTSQVDIFAKHTDT